MMKIFDKTKCKLGEGPLWHPVRQELFWFDILSSRMLHKKTPQQEATVHAFDRMVSAAGWVDENVLLLASEVNLFLCVVLYTLGLVYSTLRTVVNMCRNSNTRSMSDGWKIIVNEV